jgi:hypothetical protein
MEVVEVIIRIIGTTAILSLFGLIAWVVADLLGVKIGEDGED